MAEKPILFNAEMVRAILDGRKTMTRRPLKWQTKKSNWRFAGMKTDLGYPASRGFLWAGFYLGIDSMSPGYFKSPYQPGDRLYVRETWADHLDWDHYNELMPKTKILYRADREYPVSRWRPSIHMPKWAARIWLEVTDVRVERLQDITEEESIKEGFACRDWRSMAYYKDSDGYAANVFSGGWDAIYAERNFGWAVNPWVWVIEFEKSGI